MLPLRSAIRSLRRSPGYALAAIVVLTVALAGALAVATLGDALFVRALPIAEPERLVTLSAVVSEPDVVDLARTLDSEAALAAFTGIDVALDLGNGAEQVGAEVVTPDYFRVVGVDATLGRTFAGDPAVDSGSVVLAHGAWLRRFGGDRAVVGRSVRINGGAFTIVGVVAERFAGVDLAAAPELWVTLDSAPVTMPGWEFRGVREERFLSLVARLRPGSSLERLGSSARSARAELARDFPKIWSEVELTAAPAEPTAATLRNAIAPVVRALAIASGALLFVAAINLGLLALARAEARAAELVVRAALGASWRELLTPAIVETALLTLASGLLALAAAPALARSLAAFLPDLRGVALDLRFDGRLAAEALAATALLALSAAVVTSLALRRSGLAQGLVRRDASSTRGGARLRSALVAAEVALALPLVAGAILFVRSLDATGAVDPGFQPRGVTTLRLNASTVGFDRVRGAESLGAALDAVRTTPGVASAGGGFLLPLGFGDIARPIVAAGAQLPPNATEPEPVGYNVVTEGYFETLGIPLVAGRDFSERDRADASKAIVVSRALAARLFPGREPATLVGERIELPTEERGESYELVGVVGDVRNVALESAPKPLFYLPWRQNHRNRLALVVRAEEGAGALGERLRDALRRAAPALPVDALQPYDAYLTRKLARPRALAALVGVTAAIAALLAALGLFGVVAIAIERRRHELGVRLALGATPQRAARHAARSGLVPLAFGLAAGSVLTLFVARALSSLVYGVSADALPLVLSGLVATAAVGVAASLVAARRAVRLDPAELLRGE